MRNSTSFFTLAVVCAALTLVSCNKNEDLKAEDPSLSASEISLIENAGLQATGATKVDGDYLIEGDLLLSADDLRAMAGKQDPSLIVANTEQYRTTNLVTSLPRTLTIRYAGTRATVSSAINSAISRYNVLNLRVRFQRVTTAANITVYDVSGVSYIASAGFPSGGNPYYRINFNVAYAGWVANTLTTVMAHEVGHCIGFRHTDYMNRQYSCGGSYYNEGSAGIGAIHIPGTPTGPDPNSWMLSCIGNGVNRPFNANDRVALNYVY